MQTATYRYEWNGKKAGTNIIDVLRSVRKKQMELVTVSVIDDDDVEAGFCYMNRFYPANMSGIFRFKVGLKSIKTNHLEDIPTQFTHKPKIEILSQKGNYYYNWATIMPKGDIVVDGGSMHYAMRKAGEKNNAFTCPDVQLLLEKAAKKPNNSYIITEVYNVYSLESSGQLELVDGNTIPYCVITDGITFYPDEIRPICL